MINIGVFLAGVYMVFSPAPLMLGIILCTKKKKENNSVSSVKPPEAIKNAVVGDQKKDCGENDPDLVSRLQWQESTPAGDSMQPADAPPDATGELVSIINSVPPPATAASPRKKDNSVASTILLSISKQLRMAPSDFKAAADLPLAYFFCLCGPGSCQTVTATLL
uniref:RIC3 domain-containing protein n=1 Tax=Ascaris lumbricoides TaxID=6252 RepID=A0A0M3HWG0_ASCLU